MWLAAMIKCHQKELQEKRMSWTEKNGIFQRKEFLLKNAFVWTMEHFVNG